MKMIRSILIILLVTGFSFSAFAQKTTPKNTLSPQEKAVLEEILFDSAQLKLPENRAWVSSQIAKHLWKDDEKRARKLLAKSLEELMIAQENVQPPVTRENKNLYYGIYPRLYITKTISDLDPELAYEYLLQSRPQRLLEIIVDFKKTTYTGTREPKISVPFGEEITQENILGHRIIQKNPNRAVEFINEDIKYMVKIRTLDYLKSLYEIDPVLANELTEKAVEKLLSTKLIEDDPGKWTLNGFQFNFLTVSKFLEALGKDDRYQALPMTVSNETLKKLAGHFLNYWIASKRPMNKNWSVYRTILRFFPDRASVLKSMESQNKVLSPKRAELNEFQKLNESDLPEQELLSAIEDFPFRLRIQVYEKIACRLANEGNFDKAKNFLNGKHSDTGFLERLKTRIFYALAIKAIAEKRFGYAEKAIDQVSDSNFRSQAYFQLALEIFNNEPAKNKEKALAFVSKAQFEIENSSQKGNKLSDQVRMISLLSAIDPAKAFERFDLYINDLNQYQKEQLKYLKLRDREKNEVEFTIFHYQNNVRLAEILTNLKNKDYRKTLDLINKLEEPGDRIKLKLQLFQNQKRRSPSFRSFRVCRQILWKEKNQ